ncbi:FtsX-like permease family protein, partial [Candidatus Poribacteria bacterium]|nr:FtsX-like permease family protein [Candidatus Poribacteria bacterium]
LNNLLCILTLAFFTLVLNAFLFNYTSVYKDLELSETVPPLVAFLNDTVIEEDAKTFANQIQKQDKILFIDFVSKEENLNRAEKQFGSLAKLIKRVFTDSNPFPASLEIYVDASNVSRKTLEEISYEIESFAQIDDVNLTGSGILTDLFRQTTRMTIACISITVLLIILTIRAAVIRTARSRHDEIQLITLIGATRGHIRNPFLFQGLFLGFFGTLGGLACFYMLYCAFTYQLGVLEFLPYNQLLSVVCTGVLLGLFAGILANRKYTKTHLNEI